ncbi:MAG: ATP phosphoribosyltransferase regulatory subunit, partial [Gaiellaceae bacterium]
IGDANCRPAYVERLNAWLDEHVEVLDEDTRHKRATSPLQVFDVKSPQVREALAAAPTIGESLCAACREHFDAVRRHLDACGVPYVLDPTLVRGLDYYTRTTFEFVGPDENANSTICGGGRYDGLVEAVGGPVTPGMGFGAGLERLLLAVEREGPAVKPARLDAFVVTDDRDAVLPLLAELRRAGVSVDADYAGRSRNAQLKHAQRLDPRRIVVLEDGQATIRERGVSDVTVPLAELAARLER